MEIDTGARRRAAVVASVALAIIATMMPIMSPAEATGAGHVGPTRTMLLGTGPTEVVDHHEAAAGGWTFLVEGNRHVTSVRLVVYETAESTCTELSPTPLYEEKVTGEELRAGTALREPAFEAGDFCVRVSLDGVRKAEAAVETRHPEPVIPDPEPTASPSPSATASPEPSPSASPSTSPSPTDSPSASPSTSPSPTDSPSASPSTSPSPTDSPTASPSTSPSPSEPPAEPGTSAEYERCTANPEVDHRVLAGATGPDPEAPFIYQKFYPSTLQVHQGDLVGWCFNGGYDWHTVTFLPADMDVAQHPEPTTERAGLWRWDETGQKAFNEAWMFGPDLGDEEKACGRGPYFGAAAQSSCDLRSTETPVGSSIWDRFFSTSMPGTFSTRVNLPPGTYRYHCNIHASMDGFIEVVPENQTPTNPTPAQIDAEIAADHVAAKEVADALSDPSDAYDFKARRWTVQVGAETADRAVAIEQFLPARIDVRKGDTVRFVAGSDEPNTVTFPGGRQIDRVPESDLQGGFSAQGQCNMHSCPTGRGAPWGMTGLAFVWNCDADGRSSGAPGTLPYVPAATAGRTNGADVQHGCVAGGLPEMITQPWYGDQQRAPGDLLLTEKTFHNSGTVLDEDLPDWYRKYPASGPQPSGVFPSTFDAKFPTSGTFAYFCAAHEFMNGAVVVKP